MKKIKLFILLIFVSLLSACATIPQESVDLSRNVGVGLTKQHKSQIDLLNLHFAIKRKALDEAMKGALDTYFKNLISDETITLNKKQLSDIAADVKDFIDKNNKAKKELEKARVMLIKKLDENYLALNQANSSITGLLQSAVTVEEARSEAFQALSRATEGRIDLEKVFAELDEFILKGGEDAGKTIELVEKLKALLGDNQENKEVKK